MSGCRHHLLSNQEKLFKPFPLKSEAKQFCFSPFRVWYFPSNCLCISTLSHQIKDLPSVFRFPCELFSSQAVIPINPHFQAHPLPAPCHDSFINPLANTPVPSWALLSPTHPTFAVKSITKLDPVKQVPPQEAMCTARPPTLSGVALAYHPVPSPNPQKFPGTTAGPLFPS